MKYIIFFVLSLVTLQRSVAGDKPAAANEYVKFGLSLSQKSLKPGAKAQLLLSLTPKKGIHINL
ncbi:MAG: hypothetical protein HY277_01880 [Ignavibacteriales bacterium]|nr:hypothetical protein [Ignavibacteriales bacterium]